MYKNDSKKDLILKVNLEYPKELHDLHNDLPLAPQKMKVSKSMLPNYCNRISEKCNLSTCLVKKLITNLYNKKDYVLHYRNLQLYTDIGMKVKKGHCATEFNQSPWLKKYIDLNTEKRKNSKDKFEKSIYKLCNNAIFGKSCENLCKRVDVRLVTDEKKLSKLASQPSFVSSKIFNENLVAVHKVKEMLKLNRPHYIGMSILDISKTLIYDFHYNFIKKKYNDKAILLFTDNDSLTYQIETDDVYEGMSKNKELFDKCDYPKESPFYFDNNKTVVGKMKDECGGKVITEFVGLRFKMYSYIKDDGKGTKTAKGIKKNVVKKDVKHGDYKDVLFSDGKMHHKMKTIRSKLHNIGTYEINKVSLS